MDTKLVGSLCFLGNFRTLVDASGKKNGAQKRRKNSVSGNAEASLTTL